MSFETYDMTGTTGSNFKLVAVTEKARIGKRDLHDGTTRVRVESVGSQSFTFPEGWAKPGSDHGTQERHSIVVPNGKADAAILDAFRVVSGVSLSNSAVLKGEIKTRTVQVLDGPVQVEQVLTFPSYR